jgi:hypothetical protein
MNAASHEAGSWLAHRGRFVDVTFLLRKGEAEYLVTVERGNVTDVRKGPLSLMPRWSFAFVASDEAWARFWAPTPPPRYHDLLGMVKCGLLRVEGDHLVFMQNLLFFKDLVRSLGSRLA